ncbi:glycosyltransferase family 87 protein [Burkholderia anthinoferrum]|uniref:glycosyltransferase family 87 protein n=1 Tax=Burkholderia anthinoferrum TaxID=3090833 RepID=UPI000CE213EA|nr:glycosyltransferase family 87 protein [Burkholderia anthinoferrum]
MDISGSPIRRGGRPVRAWLTPARIALYSAVMLAIGVLLGAILLWIGLRSTEPGTFRPGSGYMVFWSASHLMLHGSPWQAYDIPAFSRALAGLFPLAGRHAFLPWLYPPSYLLAVTPLALLPYAISYPLFVVLGVVLLGLAVWRVSGLGAVPDATRIGWLALLACPGVLVTAIYGQNAMLTAACAALAVYFVDRRPMLAGLCIGLLSVKPQLAVLFQFVLIAARAWRAFAWAAAWAIAITALGIAAGGMEPLRLFLRNAGALRSLTIEHGVPFWFASPTPFAAFRLAGLSPAAAFAGQAAVAAIALAAACQVWRRSRDVRLRGAALVVATLVANPYVWHYELSWLCIPIACMIAIGSQHGWRRGEQCAVAAMWALPLYEFLNPWMTLPQIGPAITSIALLVLLQRARSLPRSPARR